MLYGIKLIFVLWLKYTIPKQIEQFYTQLVNSAKAEAKDLELKVKQIKVK